MSKKVSIVVPVYNTQNYLDRCVASLLNQTYTNLEVLLVDDGSTDNSAAMCDEWAARDCRVKVHHKENAGQCTARNLGMDMSQGEYITFVDSDDYIEPNMYECLVRDMEAHGADISCCASTHGDETRGGAVQAFDNEQIMLMHLYDFPGVGQAPCGKLYKREILDGVRFPMLRAYEDCATIYKALAKCNKLVFRDATFYHYILRENSTITQKFSHIKFKQIEAYWLMYQDYRVQYPQYANIVKSKLIGSCQYCIGESYRHKKQRELCSEIGHAQDKLKMLSASGLSMKLSLTRRLMISLPSLFGWIYTHVK